MGYYEPCGIQTADTEAEKEVGGKRPGRGEEEVVGTSSPSLQATTCSLRHQGLGSWGTVRGW